MAIGDTLLHATPESVSMARFSVKLSNACQSRAKEAVELVVALDGIESEIMILVPHYNQLYDERQKPGFKSSDP
jgi:hypothetical protein